jgi:hypothetical protein
MSFIRFDLEMCRSAGSSPAYQRFVSGLDLAELGTIQLSTWNGHVYHEVLLV